MAFVFVLDIQTYGNITQLAYHTSCFFPDTNKIILTGGIKFEDNKASEYYGLPELIVYDLNSPNDKNKVISEKFILNVDPQMSLFMSGHCCSVSEDNIFLSGGHQTLSSKIDEMEKLRARSKGLMGCTLLQDPGHGSTRLQVQVKMYENRQVVFHHIICHLA